MKKLLYSLFIMVSTFIILPSSIKADTVTIIDKEGVFVRKGPGTNYDKDGLLSYGDSVTLATTTTKSGTGCTSWYQINYNNSTDRYVCSELVSLNSNSTSTTILPNINANGYYTSDTWGTRINENYASVRTNGSYNAAIIENLFLGTNVKINSCTGNWCNVTYYGSKTGYVNKALLSSYEEITTTDEEYTKILKEKGFPNSYIPFLTFLHKKYPNWIFKPITMAKTFNTVIKMEEGKNSLPNPPDIYKLSLNIRENPNWYTTTSYVDAVFLDPRTYLTEKNIFAFEDLQYDKDFPNQEIIELLFKDTYLTKIDTDPSNTDKFTFIDYFMKAGEKYGVSPAHLAVRAKQEGMTDENYSAVSGIATTNGGSTYRGYSLDGYYNFFNINAYQDNYTNSSVTRGLAYAAILTLGADNSYGKPWNTRKKAIYGGAQFLGQDYVSVGQYTTYFQKFDISPTSQSSYTHQYMSNIIAPASESLSTYESRTSANLMNTSFVFSIPVYSDLSESFTTHPIIGNNDNSLSDIKINGTTIVNFDRDVLTYTQTVVNTLTKVELTATATSSTSTIEGTGIISLDSDSKDITLKVTSEVGTTKTYTITIKKSESNLTEENTIDDILKNVDVKLSNEYLTGIEINTTANTLINTINNEAPTTTITITTKDEEPKTDNLATGDIITIKNGTETKAYTIVIKGDTNGDGKIDIVDLLRVQKHILKYITLTNDLYDASDTNYDGKIDIVDLLRIQKHILGYIKLK